MVLGFRSRPRKAPECRLVASRRTSATGYLCRRVRPKDAAPEGAVPEAIVRNVEEYSLSEGVQVRVNVFAERHRKTTAKAEETLMSTEPDHIVRCTSCKTYVHGVTHGVDEIQQTTPGKIVFLSCPSCFTHFLVHYQGVRISHDSIKSGSQNRCLTASSMI